MTISTDGIDALEETFAGLQEFFQTAGGLLVALLMGLGVIVVLVLIFISIKDNL